MIDWFSSHPRRAKAANEQFKPSPLPPKPAAELLNAEQQVALARVRRGEAPFRFLNEVGVTPEMQIELSMSGEI